MWPHFNSSSDKDFPEPDNIKENSKKPNSYQMKQNENETTKQNKSETEKQEQGKQQHFEQNHQERKFVKSLSRQRCTHPISTFTCEGQGTDARVGADVIDAAAVSATRSHCAVVDVRLTVFA